MDELTYEQRRKKFLLGLEELCLKYDFTIEVLKGDMCLVDEFGEQKAVGLFNVSGIWGTYEL